jgi:hypothetical protein
MIAPHFIKYATVQAFCQRRVSESTGSVKTILRTSLDITVDPGLKWGFLNEGRLSQVVRQRSAKPLYGGSNPPAASSAAGPCRVPSQSITSKLQWGSTQSLAATRRHERLRQSLVLGYVPTVTDVGCAIMLGTTEPVSKSCRRLQVWLVRRRSRVLQELNPLTYKSFWGGGRGGTFCKKSLPGILRGSLPGGPAHRPSQSMRGSLCSEAVSRCSRSTRCPPSHSGTIDPSASLFHRYHAS